MADKFGNQVYPQLERSISISHTNHGVVGVRGGVRKACGGRAAGVQGAGGGG